MNNDLFTYLNIKDISSEKRDEINSEIDALTRQVVMEKVLTLLSREEQAEFLSKINKDNPSDEWLAYLKTKITDLELILDSAIKHVLQDIKLGKVELKTLSV